jgi:hypothetical protein
MNDALLLYKPGPKQHASGMQCANDSRKLLNERLFD